MTNNREFVFVLGGDSSGLQDASRRADAALKSNADATRQVAASQREANGVAERFAMSLDKVAGVLAGGFVGSQAVYALVGFNRALIEAQINAERLQMQLTAGVGPSRAAQEFANLRELTGRLGLDLNSTAVAYARFSSAARGTSLEGQAARQVFEAVSTASAVMGLNVAETEGALRALEQMMSKGRVQAEELRGQLGDRLPGALQIAARAMGVTVARLGEMAERGELLSSEFLPRFGAQLQAEIGGGAEAAAQRLEVAQRRMQNSFEALKQALSGGVFAQAQAAAFNILTDRMQGLNDAFDRARKGGEGVSTVLLEIAQTVNTWTPFGILSGESRSLEARLKAAVDRLNDLQDAAERAPRDVYITRMRDDAAELVAKLTQARALIASGAGAGNESGAETSRLGRYETAARVAEEAATRRREALAKVTSDLAGETSQLAKAMKVLEDARDAGDLSASEFAKRQRQAQERWGGRAAPRGPKAEAGNPLERIEDEWARRIEEWRTRNETALDRAEEDAARDEERIRGFMLSAVQRSDERVIALQQRRAEQIEAAIEQFGTVAQQIDAGLIASAAARGQALLAIERAQIQSRIALLSAEGEERQRVVDAAEAYMAARERQLTEELKPEWQRRAEAWADTTELMRRSYDDLMTGFVDRGQEAFEELLATGKLNTRSLVTFVAAEFSKLAYKRFLAPVITKGLESVFGIVFGGAGGGAAGGGGRRAAGGPIQAGAVHGIAEAEPEVFTARSGARYLISGQDGWVSPLAAMAGGARGGGGVVQNLSVTYNVPAGQSAAEYAMALERHTARLRAELMEDIARPGRGMNRAVLAAM